MIDYILVVWKLLPFVSDFQVGPPLNSDYLPLSCGLTHSSPPSQIITQDTLSNSSCPAKIKWNERTKSIANAIGQLDFRNPAFNILSVVDGPGNIVDVYQLYYLSPGKTGPAPAVAGCSLLSGRIQGS